ncbi:MAG TPA: DUF4019 domain-containing protein [Rudaea sp.]
MRLAGLVGCIALAALAGCSTSQTMSLAEQQVPRFHELLDAGKFQEIYSDSSDELKKASSEKDFIALLEAIHRKLGPSRSSEKQSWNINMHTSGTFVTLVYKTTYSEGEASENFVYRVTGEQAQLVGYHVSSNALILK